MRSGARLSTVTADAPDFERCVPPVTTTIATGYSTVKCAPPATKMAAGLRAMLSAARTHPRATNAVVAGSCGACGDWMTQTGASPEAPFDVRRNLAFAAFGAFWSVPGRLFYIALVRASNCVVH